MIFRLLGLTIGISVAGYAFCLFSHFSNLRTIAESEKSYAAMKAHVYASLTRKYGTAWTDIELIMNAEHGEAWTNEMTTPQMRTLHLLTPN